MQTVSTTYFVYTGVKVFESLSQLKLSCRKYLVKLLASVDAPISEDLLARRTLANALLKAHVLDTSDPENNM